MCCELSPFLVLFAFLLLLIHSIEPGRIGRTDICF